jgi:Raf kinase inhibitor-like YbhB/YbcL family protein
MVSVARIPMTISISSPAFEAGGTIPPRYTCEGPDVSPPLSWTGVPSTARSLALIVDDPDAPDPQAPKTTWVHWVVCNLPAGCAGLAEDCRSDHLPDGALQGANDWHRTGYGGPCPPVGRHRYFFKLYALDTGLSGLKNPTKADLERAMDGHVVAQGQLLGTYQKQRS